MKYVFGVDIGGTTVKIGLFDVEGNVLDKWEIPTRTENEGEQYQRKNEADGQGSYCRYWCWCTWTD